MCQIQGSSIPYRIAADPQQGRKALMMRTIRPLDSLDPELERVAKANEFYLGAGVDCEDQETIDRTLDHLCQKNARHHEKTDQKTHFCIDYRVFVGNAASHRDQSLKLNPL